jgi:predicted RNA-binding Zn-ribbon protein involved in translation (DUF1610 family)
MPDSRRPDDADLQAGKNPIHTTVFAVLFVLMVIGVPYIIGGIIGFFMAPVIGAGLWVLYGVTLPRGPHQPSIAETAGSSACPSCGSMQTDRRRFVETTQTTWQCFACGHEW